MSFFFFNTMQVVTLKMERNMLEEIDDSLEENLYATRTEFIRDCIRQRLKEIEVQRRMNGLLELQKKTKGKTFKNLSKDELDRMAEESFKTGRDGFKELGIKESHTQ